jgi:hypothetical protein
VLDDAGVDLEEAAPNLYPALGGPRVGRHLRATSP